MCWACNLLALMLSNDVNLSHISNGYYSIYVERKEINPFLLTCPILRHMNDMSNFNGIILVFYCVGWCHHQFKTVQGLLNQNNSFWWWWSCCCCGKQFLCQTLCVLTGVNCSENDANCCILKAKHDTYEWNDILNENESMLFDLTCFWRTKLSCLLSHLKYTLYHFMWVLSV